MAEVNNIRSVIQSIDQSYGILSKRLIENFKGSTQIILAGVKDFNFNRLVDTRLGIVDGIKALITRSTKLGSGVYGDVYLLHNSNDVLKVISICKNYTPNYGNEFVSNTLKVLCTMAEKNADTILVPNGPGKIVMFMPNYLSEILIGLILTELNNYGEFYSQTKGAVYDQNSLDKTFYVISEKLTDIKNLPSFLNNTYLFYDGELRRYNGKIYLPLNKYSIAKDNYYVNCVITNFDEQGTLISKVKIVTHKVISLNDEKKNYVRVEGETGITANNIQFIRYLITRNFQEGSTNINPILSGGDDYTGYSITNIRTKEERIVVEYNRKTLRSYLNRPLTGKMSLLDMYRYQCMSNDCFFFQVFYALDLAQKAGRFVHNDLHPGNLLIKEMPLTLHVLDDYNGGYYLFKSRFNVSINDFGYSRFEKSEGDNTYEIIPRYSYSGEYGYMNWGYFNPYIDGLDLCGALYNQPFMPKEASEELFLLLLGLKPTDISSDPIVVQEFIVAFNNEIRCRKYGSQTVCDWRVQHDKIVDNPLKNGQFSNLTIPYNSMQNVTSYYANKIFGLPTSQVSVEQIEKNAYGVHINNKNINSSMLQSNRLKWQIKNYKEFVNLKNISIFKRKAIVNNNPSNTSETILFQAADTTVPFAAIRLFKPGDPIFNSIPSLRSLPKPYTRTYPYSMNNSKNSMKQYVTVVYIDTQLAKANGYSFVSDCCRLDIYDYLSNYDSGIAINSTYFDIKPPETRDYIQIGPYKNSYYHNDPPTHPVPPLYQKYYGAVVINQQGGLDLYPDYGQNPPNNITNYFVSGPMLVDTDISQNPPKTVALMTDKIISNTIRDNVALFQCALRNPAKTADTGNPNTMWVFKDNGFYPELSRIPEDYMVRDCTGILPGELPNMGNNYPRTALVWRDKSDGNGDIAFVYVEGRDDRGVGMTAVQLAEFCIQIGGYRALNLDGGSSSNIAWKNPGENILWSPNPKNLKTYPMGGMLGLVKPINKPSNSKVN